MKPLIAWPRFKSSAGLHGNGIKMATFFYGQFEAVMAKAEKDKDPTVRAAACELIGRACQRPIPFQGNAFAERERVICRASSDVAWAYGSVTYQAVRHGKPCSMVFKMKPDSQDSDEQLYINDEDDHLIRAACDFDIEAGCWQHTRSELPDGRHLGRGGKCQRPRTWRKWVLHGRNGRERRQPGPCHQGPGFRHQ